MPGLYGDYGDAVKGFEGFAPRASWDYKQHSNGYGTRAQYPGEEISREEAERRFSDEFAKARSSVDAFAPNAPAGVKGALSSLTYNAGPGWQKSGLGQLIQAGDYAGAKERFLQYNKAGGQTNTGLVNRRQQEAAWFDTDAAPTDVSSVNRTPGRSMPTQPPLNLDAFQLEGMQQRGMMQPQAQDQGGGMGGFFQNLVKPQAEGGYGLGERLRRSGAGMMALDSPEAARGILNDLNSQEKGAWHMVTGRDGNLFKIHSRTGQVVPVEGGGPKPSYSTHIGPNGEVVVTDNNSGVPKIHDTLGRKVDESALKEQGVQLTTAQTLHNTSTMAADFRKKLDNKELDLGWLQWPRAKVESAFGISSPQTQNYNAFQSFRQDIVQSVLQAAKGTQTEGDAQRALTQFTEGVASGDNATVKNALDKLVKINGQLIGSRKTGFEATSKAYKDNPAFEPFRKKYDEMDSFYKGYGAPTAGAPTSTGNKTKSGIQWSIEP